MRVPTRATSVDGYLTALPVETRAVLEHLRATIRTAVPEATESISYGMPAFKLRGRLLLSYGAFTHHCSLFPASGAIIEALGDELNPYLFGRATIRFPIDRPLPDDLVREIVGVRVSEHATDLANGPGEASRARRPTRR
jgi:uncharacterized protein YdhG (YjbR/CyaY superfamily)